MGRGRIAAIVLAGCSSGGGGSATVEGTFKGQPIVVSDVVGLLGTETINGVQWSYAGVVISDASGTCGTAQQKGVDAILSTNADLLEIGTKSSTIPFAPGTYTLGTTGLAEYFYTGGGNAGDGTITFTTITDATLSGTFDVNLAGGFHLTGTFSAPVCKLPSSDVPFY